MQTRKIEAFFEKSIQDEGALRAVYTRDAILIEADGNAVRGSGAIARHFKNILASGGVASFKVTTTTFRTNGVVSYAGGYEDIVERSANGPRHSRNRFLTVLRRGPDGVWRFDYIMEAR
jgi:ketosteroid isomerase-like protein